MTVSRLVLAVFLAGLSVAVALSFGRTADATPPDNSRRIELINRSGKNLVVDWVNPSTGDVVTLAQSFGDGAVTTFDTYVNHTFALREQSSEDCGSLENESCKVEYIVVSENNEQIAVVRKGLRVSFEDDSEADLEEATGRLEECQADARQFLAAGYSEDEVMAELVECLEEATTDAIKGKNEEIAFERQLRLQMSEELENHTCAEPFRETNEPIDIRTWTHQDSPGNSVTRDVLVLHDRAASQIHALKSFISADECDAIQQAAEPILHRGTVANGAGGHKLSEHRKAWQAGIKVPWNKEQDGDLIARVVRRIYDYTNDVVGYNLTIDGQEDLMSIQYFGIGKDSKEAPDQYRPHCDGDCDGLPHKRGGRVATMVMYCDVPDLGGATNFQNAGVYVKPELGSAAFFSYLDVKTMKKETGFTSHSGCPVIEGTKRIAVHWLRHGVDTENPWNSFNTLTIKKEDEDC